MNQLFEFFSKKFKSEINSTSKIENAIMEYENLNIAIWHSDTFLKDESKTKHDELIKLLQKYWTVTQTGKKKINNTQYIKIWVGIIIKNWNKVLLWHRCENRADTWWIHEPDTRSFPWWKQEYNETVFQAAIREVKEETNLNISHPKVIAALDDITEDRHFVTIWLVCEDFSWELKCMEPTKEDERKRFELDNLPKNLYSPTKHLLDYYIH